MPEQMQSRPIISVEQKQSVLEQLREAKQIFAAKGWFPATSGNLSIRVYPALDAPADVVASIPCEDWVFAITASGKDKTVDSPSDYLFINGRGEKHEETSLKPSAETSIHQVLYASQACGAVYHVHTVWNNLASDYYWPEGAVPVKAVELIKAFNIWSQDAEIQVPIVENWTNVPKISETLTESIVPHVPGILLRNHGIYAWGATPFEAKRHLEAFEFLFEYAMRKLMLPERK